MTEVGFTKRAKEKYDLLINGIKGEISSFLKELAENKIDVKSLNILSEDKEHNFIVYYREFEKMAVILTKSKEVNWIILDFLTPQEFKSLKIVVKI